MSGNSKDGADFDPATSAHTAHVPPVYNVTPDATTASGGGTKKRPQRQVSLTRTASHRELYDADSQSAYGEHGSLSHHRNDSIEGLGREASAARRARSRPSSGNVKERQKPGLIEEVQGYMEEDAKERGQEVKMVKEVQRGKSGETVRQEEEREVDLEKQGAGRESGSLTNSTDQTSRNSNKEEDLDPNIVTWDSPESMENPRNWSLHRRWSVIVIVSSYTFLSPLSSSMIAPALPTISNEFHITSSVLSSLMLSVFVLAYAIGPLFLAPLSEMFGRRVVLQSSNAFFIIFTVACAVAQNRVQLSIFRFFAGLGGSAPLTIGGGTVSDLMQPEERGVAMSIYSLGPLMGPALGPIIGAWIVERTGNWRWIFGVACIAAGVTASIGLFILPETYAPTILGAKAARLRKETGNEKLHTVFDKDAVSWQTRFKHNMVRPFVLISTQPIIILLGVYLMITYGCMYLLLTSFNSVFQEVYDESVGIASLNYLSLALGFTLGGQICGRLNDYNYKRLRSQNGGVGLPEFKLPVMMATSWMPAVGLFIYGWTAEYKVHWIAPNIGAAILAFGMISTFQAVQTYTVDTYTLYAASALSANTFLRSLAGFALPLSSGALYANLGYGWGNSVLGFIAAVAGIPTPFLLYKYGQRIRAKSQYASG